MLRRRIYLDYASLTPIDPRVQKEMRKFSSWKYGNPSSWYKEGVLAKKALDNARKAVSGFIRAHDDEIVFTSGGTEANNLAILGAIEEAHNRGLDYSDMNVIVSAIEHSSIMKVCEILKKKNVKVEYLSVDNKGVVDLGDLNKKINANTIIVSVMAVNNEVGAIEPIKDIAKVIRHYRNHSVRSNFIVSTESDKRKTTADTEASHLDNLSKYPLFHTDAAQAGLVNWLDVGRLGVDLLTLDASKVYGPRGIGALYVKRNTIISPILFGGDQESGMRPGTENIPGIVGFAKAIELLSDLHDKEVSRISRLKEIFVEGLRKIKSDMVINASGSPHILNVSFPGIDNEFFVFQLDARGIACSTKSSCLKDSDDSYVLRSIGADSQTSVRFSFGRWTKKGDIKRVLRIISDILKTE
jgi:cysteine desulfurase